jgi:TonB family protein
MHAIAFLVLLSTAVMAQSSADAFSPSEPPSATSRPVPIGSHSCVGYPQKAKDAHVEGTTILSFKITAAGAVTDIAIEHSSGNEDLDNASIACAEEWRYVPTTHEGVPTEGSSKAAVKWILSPESDPMFAIFSRLLSDVQQCATTPAPSADEFRLVTRPTAIEVQFTGGAVASARLAASSGSDTLDRRAVGCYRNLPPEITKGVPNRRQVIPFFWKRTK